MARWGGYRWPAGPRGRAGFEACGTGERRAVKIACVGGGRRKRVRTSGKPRRRPTQRLREGKDAAMPKDPPAGSWPRTGVVAGAAAVIGPGGTEDPAGAAVDGAGPATRRGPVAPRARVFRGQLPHHPVRRGGRPPRRRTAQRGPVRRGRCGARRDRAGPLRTADTAAEQPAPRTLPGRLRGVHLLRLPLHRCSRRDVRLLRDGPADAHVRATSQAGLPCRAAGSSVRACPWRGLRCWGGDRWGRRPRSGSCCWH